MSKGIRCTLFLPDHWTKRARFQVWMPVRRGGYDVDAGRWTDFASIPWLFRALFPPIDRYALSALIHDCALADGLGWQRANAIFARGLVEDGVAAWRRFLILSAVRANGTFQRVKQRLGMEGRYVREK